MPLLLKSAASFSALSAWGLRSSGCCRRKASKRRTLGDRLVDPGIGAGGIDAGFDQDARLVVGREQPGGGLGGGPLGCVCECRGPAG